MLGLKTILHPTDFSNQADHAFELAWCLARDHGACLVLLHVVPPPVCHAEELARRPPDGYCEQMWHELIRLQPADSSVHVERILEEGDVAEIILRVARETKADMIVMGTHGRTRLARLLMGSVAEQVLRQAACPVLALKTPIREQSAASTAEQNATCTG